MPSTRSPRQQGSFATLRQFVRERAAVQRCELCGAELASEHQHLVEPAGRQLLCCCDACAILFSSQESSRYRRVPRRIRFLPDFHMADAQWDSLMIPISLAFFFQSIPAGRVVAFYPSPAGATESLLDLGAWEELVRDNPILAELEPLRDPTGAVVGVIVREQQAIEGAVELVAERAGDRLFKIMVRVLNLTPLELEDQKSRDKALMRSFASTHTILGVRAGQFVSLLDPPEQWREIAAGCRNVGGWPVLVGEIGERDTMLASPIILYDYPQIAPESPGDLFDGTEIDEILTLRIMTMTEDEKREMAAVDECARVLLDRTEALAREQLMGLHGTMRSLRPLEGGR